MKKSIVIAMTAVLCVSCGQKQQKEGAQSTTLSTPSIEEFDYKVDRFADVEVIRYRVPGIENLSLKQQEMLYYLSEAAICGRDILFDQNGKYNLAIRTLLEAIYVSENIDKNTDEFRAMELYLKRVWLSNSIHHHYSGDKFKPEFSQPWFEEAVSMLPVDVLPLGENQSVAEFVAEITPVIFDPTYMAQHKNQSPDEDIIATSASNYYKNVTQAEAVDFYGKMKDANDPRPISYGMNSRLVKGDDGKLFEEVYKVGGKYSAAMEKIVYWLEKAAGIAETEAQRVALEKMISFYRTGDLKEFDEYAVLWVNDTESLIDYVCGYTESYGDPLGMKASWEALINFKDLEATERTIKISDNAQWFEDNSPIEPEFKKEECRGVTAKVINAAMMGGDCYPTTPLGINLPNANWIRAEHGSKSVTIENVSEAYAQSSAGSGFNEEFVWSDVELEMMNKYKYITDNLHTDLHECLGHGSGKLAPGVDPDALGAYGAVVEEARADLFGLYYIADAKMVELGLLPDAEAYKAQYYSYLMNGLMTQTTRVQYGRNIEQTHMRNRQLVAKWILEKSQEDNSVEVRERDGKLYLVVNDYEVLRDRFGALLKEIQHIKSTGDAAAANAMVEKYAINIDPVMHRQILDRYAALNMSPYKGFVNPVYVPTFDENGNFVSLAMDYTEGYVEQHLRYSRDYAYLAHPYMKNVVTDAVSVSKPVK